MNKEPTNTKRRLYKRNYIFKKRFLKLFFDNNGVNVSYFKAKNIFLSEESKRKYIKNTAKLNNIKNYILICKQTYKKEYNEYILIFERKPITKLFKGVFIVDYCNINSLGLRTNRDFNKWKKQTFNYSHLDFKHAYKYKYKIDIIYSRSTTE